MKKFVATLSVFSAISMSVVPTFAHGNENYNFQGKQIKIHFENNGNVNLTDINGSWAEKSVLDLVKKGVLSGDNNHHFNPQNSVSRAEWATMVSRYFNLKNTSTTQDFQDVPTTSWEYPYVEATENYFDAFKTWNGGMDFKPNVAATRQDVTVTLVKILNQEDPSITVMDSADANTLLQQTFTDWNTIAPVLRPYVATAVQNNLIHGDGNGHFMPLQPLTRAQAAVMLENLLTTGIVVPGDGNITVPTSGSSSVTTLTTNNNTVVTGINNTNDVLTVANGTSVQTLENAISVGGGIGTVAVYTDNTKSVLASASAMMTNTMVVVATAQDGVTKATYTISVPTAVSHVTTLTTNNNTVVTGINNTNDVLTVALGTSVQTLENALNVGGGTGSVAVYTDNTKSVLATASAMMTNTMVVVATAQDGVTMATYSISIPAAVSNVSTLTTNNDAVVTGIDNTNEALTVANGTTVQSLENTLSVGSGTGSVAVYTDNTKSVLASASAMVTNTMVVVATAQDGVTKATYVITI